MSDENAQRKLQIIDRAKRSKNVKVVNYVRRDLVDKIDEAGEHAGIWLESVEAHFDILTEEPEGLLKKFTEDDFNALFQAMFGYERST